MAPKHKPMAPPYAYGDAVVLVTTIGLDERYDCGENVVCRVHIEDTAGRVVNTGHGFESRHDADTFRNGAYLALRSVGVTVARMRIDGGKMMLKISDDDGDEQTCTLEAFVEANEGCEFIDEVSALDVGGRVHLGGGAAPKCVVERLS